MAERIIKYSEEYGEVPYKLMSGFSLSFFSAGHSRFWASFFFCQELLSVKLIAWQTENAKLTRELCNDLLTQLKQNHLDPVLRRLQGKEAAKMSFEEVIAGYNKIKEDYHNSAIGAKDVIAAVFFEFHPVRPYFTN